MPLEYVCNMCRSGIDVNAEDAIKLTVESGVVSMDLRLCKKCGTKVIHDLMEKCGYGPGQYMQGMRELSTITYMRYTGRVRTSDLRSLSDLLKGTPVTTIKAPVPELADKYLALREPPKIEGDTNALILIMILIRFYKGGTVQEIKEHVPGMDEECVDCVLSKFATMVAYEHWFSDREFYNADGERVDISKVLFALDRFDTYKVLTEETAVDSPKLLFEIINYYLRLSFTNDGKRRYLTSIGFSEEDVSKYLEENS